jgi:Glycosyl transferase family 2/Tetratricopeptide repeat
MAKLSLCMIARDEERFLGACLASARGVADEIVVVDTGSTDRTPRIAEEAGATLLRVPWSDDFSAARNAGLDAATGTHVLVLDADEVLAPGAGRTIRRALANKALSIGMLPLHDADELDTPPAAVLAGRRRPWPPTHLPRLFVNHPLLRFERRVHETIFLDVERKLAAIGGRILAVEAPIVHYGEVPALRAERDKKARNKGLLDRAVVESPEDGDLAGYLALEHFTAGDLAAAEAVARRHLPPFLAAIERMPKDRIRPSPIRLASVLATIALQRGRPAEALETVRRSAALCPAAHPNLRYLEGLALELLGEHADAERVYKDCLAMHGRPQTIPVNPGATNEAPRLRLANLYLVQGRPRDALEVLGPPQAIQGRLELAAGLTAAEAYLGLGDAPAALARLAPLMERPSPPPDLFALAARAAALLGQSDPAFEAAAAAAEPSAWLEPRRSARR